MDYCEWATIIKCKTVIQKRNFHHLTQQSKRNEHKTQNNNNNNVENNNCDVDFVLWHRKKVNGKKKFTAEMSDKETTIFLYAVFFFHLIFSLFFLKTFAFVINTNKLKARPHIPLLTFTSNSKHLHILNRKHGWFVKLVVFKASHTKNEWKWRRKYCNKKNEIKHKIIGTESRKRWQTNATNIKCERDGIVAKTKQEMKKKKTLLEEEEERKQLAMKLFWYADLLY